MSVLKIAVGRGSFGTFAHGNTKKTTDVMPEEAGPWYRSVIWGLQIFSACAPATLFGVIAINQLNQQRGVTDQLDPMVALVAAGIGTILWIILMKGTMPNFMGTSFTYIPAMSAITASMVGKGEGNPVQYATGAVVLSAFWTLLIAGIFHLLIRKGGAENGMSLFNKVIPATVSMCIVMIIGLSLASAAIGMASANVLLSLVTVAVVAAFRYSKGFARSIPIILGLAVMYVVGVLIGDVNLSQLVNAPLFRVPNFFLPRFSLLGFVQMAPVSLATSFETLAHVLVLQSLIGRPLMQKLSRALVADAICDAGGSAMGTSGNTTYAEFLGLAKLIRVFSNAAMICAGLWSIAFGFSGHLNAILNTVPSYVLGGLSILMFGMIASQAFSMFKEGLQSGTIDISSDRFWVIVSVMLIVGVGNLKLVIGGTEWLSGISFAIVVGVLGWPLLGLFERIASRREKSSALPVVPAK